MSILVYSKPECPWCDKAKALLAEYNFTYQEMILNKDYTKEDLQRIVGENSKITVPQVIIDNRLVGGYEKLLEYFETHSIFGIHN
jgi:glutaredoxin